jgi:hypothetical protein
MNELTSSFDSDKVDLAAIVKSNADLRKSTEELAAKNEAALTAFHVLTPILTGVHDVVLKRKPPASASPGSSASSTTSSSASQRDLHRPPPNGIPSAFANQLPGPSLKDSPISRHTLEFNDRSLPPLHRLPPCPNPPFPLHLDETFKSTVWSFRLFPILPQNRLCITFILRPTAASFHLLLQGLSELNGCIDCTSPPPDPASSAQIGGIPSASASSSSSFAPNSQPLNRIGTSHQPDIPILPPLSIATLFNLRLLFWRSTRTSCTRAAFSNLHLRAISLCERHHHLAFPHPSRRSEGQSSTPTPFFTKLLFAKRLFRFFFCLRLGRSLISAFQTSSSELWRCGLRRSQNRDCHLQNYQSSPSQEPIRLDRSIFLARN